MKNKPFKIVLLLAVMFGAALIAGPRLRPENFQLNGTLTVLESDAPTGISQVGAFDVEWTNEEGGQLIMGKKPSPKIAACSSSKMSGVAYARARP